jgi:pimeloyl-ACP methyl ester carboxylesterase
MDLHHVRRGRGEPLLLIQGMSGTHVAWGEPFLTALEDRFEIVAYDHRGIGYSPDTREPFTIRDLADDAAALLDALGWETAHVAGISMGGMVAQELAIAHGARIRTLTLGCTYAGGPTGVLADPATLQELSAAMLSGDRERALRTGFVINVSPGFGADEANYPPYREMALAVPTRLRTIMLQMQAVAGHDTSARLATIDAPTLVIHGTADRMLPPANGRAIAAAIPGARLELLDGVGHLFWWEQPERSAALIREHALAGAAR